MTDRPAMSRALMVLPAVKPRALFEAAWGLLGRVRRWLWPEGGQAPIDPFAGWAERLVPPPPRAGGPAAPGEAAPVAAAGPAEAAATPAAPRPDPVEAALPEVRDRLWGTGFALPGGEEEVLRLASLLPLSNANTLLLLDAGPGAAAAAIAAARGCWIEAHESIAAHVDRAGPLLRPFSRRVSIVARDPLRPVFKEKGHDHAMALEMLRNGGDPVAGLLAISAALRPMGQCVMTEIVLGTPGEGAELLKRWLRVERRRGPPPTESVMKAAFRKAKMHVHVTEDLAERQQRQVLGSWVQLCSRLADAGDRPARAQAAAMVGEAEGWLLRLRLLELGRLRYLRWHASKG